MKTLARIIAVVACSAAITPAVCLAQHYNETILVSNKPVANQTPFIDANLQNPWGLVHSPTSPWWISNNAAGTSTLYDATGLNPPVANPPVVPVEINGTGIVTILNAPSQQGLGSPTGVMFNGSTTDFLLAPGKPASFIFVTEDGTVQAWAGGPAATIEADNSVKPTPANGAVYKGATIAEINGQKYILAANFRSGRIDAFDTNFQQVRVSEEAFDDDFLPRGYAPFNVQGIGPNIYVSYAKQDSAKHDEVSGVGFGFVDVFSSDGRLLQRLEHGPWFNAPWGLALAPADFGEFSHAILVGNFLGGNVAAFNPVTGRFLGNVLNPDGSNVNIDGLWGLAFGNAGKSGPGNTLFFTAGPNDETDGLFGSLTPVTAELNENDEQ